MELFRFLHVVPQLIGFGCVRERRFGHGGRITAAPAANLGHLVPDAGLEVAAKATARGVVGELRRGGEERAEDLLHEVFDFRAVGSDAACETSDDRGIGVVELRPSDFTSRAVVVQAEEKRGSRDRGGWWNDGHSPDDRRIVWMCDSKR